MSETKTIRIVVHVANDGEWVAEFDGDGFEICTGTSEEDIVKKLREMFRMVMDVDLVFENQN